MAFSSDAARRRASLKQAVEFARSTFIGGALFLLPIFVVLFVVSKIVGLTTGLTEPLVTALGVTSVGGIAVSTLATVFGVILGAFLVGLFARTGAGQAALDWIQEAVASTFPQFSLLQGVAKKVGSDDDAADEEMPIVLVPTDAGWAIGLLLEAEGDWHAVYLPGAPQMSSGSVAYAHSDQIHRTDLTLKQLWVIMRGRGKGSSDIYQRLATLKRAGKLD